MDIQGVNSDNKALIAGAGRVAGQPGVSPVGAGEVNGEPLDGSQDSLQFQLSLSQRSPDPSQGSQDSSP